MSGLLSHLAVATAIAATATTTVDAPPVPELSSQVSREASAAQDTSIVTPATNVIRQEQESVSDSSGEDDLRVLAGVDVASHQHVRSPMDISRVMNDGQDFAFVKATEGTHYINPHFRPDVIDFIKESAPVGFYHYAQPTADPEDAREQAQFFINVTGLNIGVKALPPVLDIEEDNGLTPSQLIAWTHAFVDEVKEATGRDVMIYTYPNFWLNKMGNTTEFSHLPLWIAHYNNQGQPGSLPGGWESWDFWQYTSKGQLDGVEGNIDLNVFSGSSKSLADMYVASLDGKIVESEVEVPPVPTVQVIEEVLVSNPEIEDIAIPQIVAGELPELKTLLDTFAER